MFHKTFKFKICKIQDTHISQHRKSLREIVKKKSYREHNYKQIKQTSSILTPNQAVMTILLEYMAIKGNNRSTILVFPVVVMIQTYSINSSLNHSRPRYQRQANCNLSYVVQTLALITHQPMKIFIKLFIKRNLRSKAKHSLGCTQITNQCKQLDQPTIKMQRNKHATYQLYQFQMNYQISVIKKVANSKRQQAIKT